MKLNDQWVMEKKQLFFSSQGDSMNIIFFRKKELILRNHVLLGLPVAQNFTLYIWLEVMKNNLGVVKTCHKTSKNSPPYPFGT